MDRLILFTSILFLLASITVFLEKLIGVFSFKRKSSAIAFLYFLGGIIVQFFARDIVFFIYHISVIVFFVIYLLFGTLRLLKTETHLNKQKIIVILFSAISIMLLSTIPLTDFFLWIILLFMLAPFLITFFNFIFLFPEELIADMQINKLVDTVHRKKSLSVIIVYAPLKFSFTRTYPLVFSKIHNISLVKLNNISGLTSRLTKVPEKSKNIFIIHLSEKSKNIKNVLLYTKPKMIIEITHMNKSLLKDVPKRLKIISRQRRKLSQKEMLQILSNFAK